MSTENMDFQRSILSCFDLTFILLDIHNDEGVKAIAYHVLGLQQHEAPAYIWHDTIYKRKSALGDPGGSEDDDVAASESAVGMYGYVGARRMNINFKRDIAYTKPCALPHSCMMMQ